MISDAGVGLVLQQHLALRGKHTVTNMDINASVHLVSIYVRKYVPCSQSRATKVFCFVLFFSRNTGGNSICKKT